MSRDRGPVAGNGVGDDTAAATDDTASATDDIAPADVAVDDFEGRAYALRDRAASARESFDPPEDAPDSERALAFARDGVGEAAAVYIDARMQDSWVYFDDAAFDALETGLNAYLELFAACHGVDRNPDVTVRTAAETLLDTHDAVDTAVVLTGVDA